MFPYQGRYEGQLASLAPFVSMLNVDAAGATDVALGRFAWADPSNGQVSNIATEGFAFGLALPRRGNFLGEGSAVYFRGGTRYLRSGKPITLAESGEFWVKFPQGAWIGANVYTDPATGIIYASQTGTLVLTKYRAITNAAPGALGIISPYAYN
jgi:hypothetical protein